MRRHCTPEAAARFWTKVEKTEGCWLWRGALSRKGYGSFRADAIGGRQSHRVAWELTHGPIPDGLFVLHRCDTPRCVNPAHLWLGTAADNSRDMALKGRAASGERHRETMLRVAARGERSGAARHPASMARHRT